MPLSILANLAKAVHGRWMRATSSSGSTLTDKQILEGAEGIASEESEVDAEEIQMQKHVSYNSAY